MRVALVSPYSWTYPGGVTRHIEALRAELDRAGHDVTVLAPFDSDRPPDRAPAPRGASAGARCAGVAGAAGRHVRLPVQRRGLEPRGASERRFCGCVASCEPGAFDVVHIHEPVTPVVGWDALTSADAPIVGTFHCYSETFPSHTIAELFGARRKLNHLHVRIAVSEAAAWTGRRFYGGRYRVIPNGVVLPDGGVPAPRVRAPGEPLRIVFVGQSVERKGLPVLLRAFEALRGQIPAELTVIGVTADELAPLLVEGEGVRALGRVDDEAPPGGAARRRRAVRAVARRRVVRHGPDRGLRGRHAGRRVGHRRLSRRRRRRTRTACSCRAATRRRWPRPCATSRSIPARVDRLAAGAAAQRAALRVAARRRAGRDGVRGRARGAGARDRAAPRRRPDRRAARRRAARASPARRLPSLEPSARGHGQAACAAGWSAPPASPRSSRSVLAVQHIGLSRIGDALVRSSPPWVLLGLALMCASMLLRAVSWHAILKAALPDAKPRMVDAVQGTSIGVLMSATLPGAARRAVARARRGAPARPRPRPIAGGARHDRVPDADQRVRADDPRRRDVHHDRAVRRQAAGAASGTAWRRSACSASCSSRRR